MTAPSDVLLEACEMLRSIDVEFMIVGALAASVHGEPRATKDVDIVVQLPFEERDRVAALFEARDWPYEEKVDPQWGKRLMADHPSGMDLEIFFAPDHPLHRREFDRRTWIEFHGEELPFLSPEDLVLRKLVNTRLRRGQDYDDVLGVVATQGDSFDVDYVRDHCAAHRVCDRFEQALEEARDLEPEET